MISSSSYDNSQAIVLKLLKKLRVNIQPDLIIAELEKHPEYPSLLAISDVLTVLGINNSAFQIGYDQLNEVKCPYIAFVKANDGEFVVVNKKDDDYFYLSHHKWDNHKISIEEFKNTFDGVLLTVQPSEEFSTIEFAKISLHNFKLPLLSTGTVLMFFLILNYHTGYFTDLNWQSLLLALFKSAGLITSILLLIQSFDSNNPLVQKLCNSVGKSNCNAILTSKAAKVPITFGIDGLTWSEVGFFYFAGTWLLLFFGGNTVLSWRMLLILNMVSLPYTFYSIYFQARIAKQWCVLCCTVQTLLWLEFAVFVAQLNKPLISGGILSELATVAVCLLLPIFLWLLLKPIFVQIQQIRPLRQQLRNFKYNTALFYRMLNDQPQYPLPGEECSIVLGNAEATTIITLVSSPYCPPCVGAHSSLSELLHYNPDLQARIIFSATKSNTDPGAIVARHMMALNKLDDKTIVNRALHDWYKQGEKNYEKWAALYPIQPGDDDTESIERQGAWHKQARLRSTPTIIVNGFQLPEVYQLQDIKYMLAQ